MRNQQIDKYNQQKYTQFTYPVFSSKQITLGESDYISPVYVDPLCDTNPTIQYQYANKMTNQSPQLQRSLAKNQNQRGANKDYSYLKSQKNKLASSKDQSATIDKDKQEWTRQRLSYLVKNENRNTQEYVHLNFQVPNVYESEIFMRRYSSYKINIANLCASSFLTFSSDRVSLQEISKIKIKADIAKDDSFVIRLVIQNDDIYLGVQLRKSIYYLPQHYVWFAKLVNARLMAQGVKIEQKDGMKIMDANPGLGGTFIKGYILKRSKYRHQWQKRYVIITIQGLFSYRDQLQNYSIDISTDQIEELWTNFQVIDNLLIVKVRHKNEKTQFAIPIIDYCLREQCNWLYAMYRWLMEHKIHIKNY